MIFSPSTSAGHAQIAPDGPGGAQLDLCELIEQIQRRGIATPLLLRFDGILRARVRQLNEAFKLASEELDYEGGYRSVFPIKVNQERHVVEVLLEEGRRYGMGLEVGSKPELLAGIALQAGEGSLMICNGYKDAEYVEMALLSSQLGITAVLVIEKFSELETTLTVARRLGVRPIIGVRAKLSIRGSGRWHASVGDRSKFGLTTREIVAVVDELKRHDMLDCLQLVHFHLGSQADPHSPAQARDERGDPALDRPVPRRREDPLVRRGRRSRDRLRRIELELRVVDELLVAGVRQRRRLPPGPRPAEMPASRSRRLSPSPDARSSPTTRCSSPRSSA